MNQKGKQLAIWGVILQPGTVVGLVGTLIGMLRALRKLAQGDPAQTEALATDISTALYATVVGSTLALIGTVLILVALFGLRYRAPWFHVALWILAVLWLLCFPIGTILGIVIIVYLAKNRDEFTEYTPACDVL